MQSALGDIVFINLPEEGDSVTAGESFSDVESVKAVSDVFSPVHRHGDCGERGAAGRSRQVNEAPYEAWLIKVSQVSDTEELLDAEGYEAVVAAGGGVRWQLHSRHRGRAASHAPGHRPDLCGRAL